MPPIFSYLSKTAAEKVLKYIPIGDGATVYDAIKEVPGQVAETGKTIAQSVARSASSLWTAGQKANINKLEMMGVSSDTINKMKKAGIGDPIVPTTKMEKAVFGQEEEPVDVKRVAREWPFLSNLKSGPATVLGTVLAGSDFLFPGGNKIAKNVIESLARETSEDVIANITKKELSHLIPESEFNVVVKELAKAKNVSEVNAIIKTRSVSTELINALDDVPTVNPNRTVDDISSEIAEKQAKVDSLAEALKEEQGVLKKINEPDFSPTLFDDMENPAKVTEYQKIRNEMLEEVDSINKLQTESQALSREMASKRPATISQKIPPKVENAPKPIVELPKELKGAKPRYGYGSKLFAVNFESDIDKALYIVAGDKRSKADEQYMNFLRSAVGGSDEEIRAAGKSVRLQLKTIAKNTPSSGNLSFSDVRKEFTPPTLADEGITTVDHILAKTQMPIFKTLATGKEITKRNLKQEVEKVIKSQSKKISDDVIAARRNEQLLGPETIDEIISRKRGIITDKEAVETASKIRGTIDDVLKIEKGTVPTKEQLTAVSQIVQYQREVVNKLSILQKQITDGLAHSFSKADRDALTKLSEDYGKLTDSELITRAIAEAALKLKKSEIVLFAMKSETGRALQGAKQTISAVDQRMRAIYSRMKKLPDLEQQGIIEQITKTDINNDKEFLKFLDKISKTSFFDKFAEYATAAKLWNPTTHVVNLGGNTLRQLVDLGVTSLTSPSSVKADFMGAQHGLAVGLKNALHALTNEGYAKTLSKYIEEGGDAPAIAGKFGVAVRTPFRLLAASDEIFRTMAFQRSLYRQANSIARKMDGKFEENMAKVLNNPSPEMLEEATHQAKRLTFQEDMGELIKKINELRTPANYTSTTGKAASTFFRLFVPFLKTPTNLLKQAVDFSPLGFIKNFDSVKELAAKGHNEEAARRVGEAALGTAFSIYVMSLVTDGKITGGAPKEPKDRDRFYREGNLPYSIKIGDTWYQYKRIDPFASSIAMMADIISLAKKNEASMDNIVGIVSQQLQDKSYLQGISDIVKVFDGEPWERNIALKQMAISAALPSFVGNTARSIDPVTRDPRTMSENIQAQIPFMSESLPAKVDVLGNTVERANKGLNFFFNPIQSEVAEIDPVSKHLMDINYTISVPMRYFNKDKVRFDLNGREYESYSRFVGEGTYQGILKMLNNKNFKNIKPDDQIKKIETLRSNLQDQWKKEYIKSLSEEPLTQYSSAPKGNRKYEEYRTKIIDGVSAGKITREKGIELLKKAKIVSQ